MNHEEHEEHEGHEGEGGKETEYCRVLRMNGEYLADTKRLHAEVARLRRALNEPYTYLKDLPTVHNSVPLEDYKKLLAERHGLREDVAVLSGLAEREKCSCCGAWQAYEDMAKNDSDDFFCCDCYESWAYECSDPDCSYRIASLSQGTKCPQCGGAFAARELNHEAHEAHEG